MNIVVKKYRAALKKKLCCCGSAKKALTDQFDASLAAYLEEHPEPGAEELRAAFGPPEEMAAALMENTSERDRRQYQTSKLLVKIFAGVLAALILAFAVYAFWVKQFVNVEVIDSGPEIIDIVEGSGDN